MSELKLMATPTLLRTMSAGLSLSMLAACAHDIPSDASREYGPALLVDGSMENLDRVKRMLARSMDRAHIELGADDPTLVPRVSVLPPRPGSLENRSPALPVVFSISLENDICIATNTQSGEEVELTDISCALVPQSE